MNWPVFTTPWMLAGMVALGLPLLIHYLTRARPRRIPFPPYQFLLEACAGRQAIHRLRTVVLLVVRSLAVAVLVLLFARPFLRPSGMAAAANASRTVMVVDASLSMRAAWEGVPLFARAQAEAADMLRGLGAGDEAGVVLIGAYPRALLPALSRNFPALHDELVKAQATWEVGDPAAALALARRMLGDRGTICVFSDFQESNWKSVGELPPGLTVRLRPTAPQPVENTGITAVRISPSSPVAGEMVEVSCTVFNSSPRSRQEHVQLDLGDVSKGASVAVPAYGASDVSFNAVFPQAGDFAGTVSIPPDALPEDDRRYLVVRVRKALQMLLVSDADAGDRRNSAFFLSHALVPSEQAAPGLNLAYRHSQDTDRGVLETSDAFLIAAPAILTGEAQEVIARRVNEGAHLIVFLDGPTAPELATGSFAPPFQLLREVTPEKEESLSAGPRQLFADAGDADWAGVRLTRHYQTRLLEGRGDDVLLTHADGSTAISLSALGKGAVVFVNLPLTPDGGNFLGSPLFPSTLHELLRLLRKGNEQSVTPGQPWSLEAPGAGPFEVTDPHGREVEGKVVSSGRITRLALPGALLPGIYSVKSGGAAVAAAVVNIDPRESDTRPIALERLASSRAGQTTVVRDESDLLLAGKARALWPMLAAAAAALFALEMLLLALWKKEVSPARNREGVA